MSSQETETLKIADCHPEILFVGKNITYKTHFNLIGRDLIRCLTASGHLPMCTDIRLFKDKRPPTSEIDSYPKTATSPVFLWIDSELSVLFDFLYLSANDISHNNSYTYSLGYSI